MPNKGKIPRPTIKRLSLYIVDSGSFVVRKEGLEVGRCERGVGFGEIGAMLEKVGWEVGK